MYQSRRLTVQPVDAARFCGDNNATVVSLLNGIHHPFVEPAATDQEAPVPLPSRVLAHAYAGAQLADAPAHTQAEYIAEAAANSAAVIACRVTPLRPSTADPNAPYPVHAEGPTSVVFFSGCQRLAEVRISAATATSDASKQLLERCPMQCFRVDSLNLECGGSPGTISLDMAAFVSDPQTLSTCTPQLGKLQTLQFEESSIACMGPGRTGRAEVTVVLESGVVALCGARPSTSWSAAEEAVDLEDGDEEGSAGRNVTNRRAAALASSARRAFLCADKRSSFHILHTLQLPSRASAAAALPRCVAWSSTSTLWVVYTDGAVVAVQFADTESADASAEVEGTGHGGTPFHVLRVMETQLPTSAGGVGSEQSGEMAEVHLHAEPRAPVLHIAYTITAARVVHYGTVRAQGVASQSAGAHLQWRLQRLPCGDEQLYGVRFERGLYRVLMQSARGAGPLCIATLPRESPVRESAAASAAPSLARTIMQCPERDLSDHCRACEALLGELQSAVQQQATSEHGADALRHRLMQAQHALYALLSRQQQSAGVRDLDPSDSLPYRLLLRATRLYRELSVYALLAQLGVTHTVTRPLRAVLRCDEAVVRSKAAQAQWTALMRDTFRRESVYQSSVAELAMWQAATPLCVDVILDKLGLSTADGACSMTALLARMEDITPDLALLVLYYSYAGMEDRTGGAGAGAQARPSHRQQRQRQAFRESFLQAFGLPVELNAWAFTCYAVDHSVHPAAAADGAAGEAPFVYVMGPAVHHLSAPPFLQLLAPVVNGLAHVAALEALLHLIPGCIAAYTAASEDMPISVAMRLLCVAVRAGSSRMIEALYGTMRGSPALRHLAAQPLAYAALHAGNVKAMRGWVEVGGPVAETVERTLQTAEGIGQREVVLIGFYMLQQDYEAALAVCGAAAAADATQAQRLQVVFSYLRSLLSISSAAWGAGEGEGRISQAPQRTPETDADPWLLIDAAAAAPLWRPTTLSAPLLQVTPEELDEQLRRAASAEMGTTTGTGSSGAGNAAAATAAANTAAGSGPTAAAAYHYPRGAVLGGAPLPHPTQAAPLFRPSTLLSSVERGSGAGSDAASSASPPPAAGSRVGAAYRR